MEVGDARCMGSVGRRSVVVTVALVCGPVATGMGVAAASASHGCARVPMAVSWFQPISTGPSGDRLPTDDPVAMVMPLLRAC